MLPLPWLTFTDSNLAILQTGCFKYFERGGECIRGPVSLLSGQVHSPFRMHIH